VTEEGRATNAHFVLGLIALHRRRATEAEQHFASALSGMLLKEEAYQTAWLMDWVRFFLAIIVAEQCQPARFYEVRALVETAMTSAAVFPLALWAQLLRATVLYDDKSSPRRSFSTSSASVAMQPTPCSRKADCSSQTLPPHSISLLARHHADGTRPSG